MLSMRREKDYHLLHTRPMQANRLFSFIGYQRGHGIFVFSVLTEMGGYQPIGRVVTTLRVYLVALAE